MGLTPGTYTGDLSPGTSGNLVTYNIGPVSPIPEVGSSLALAALLVPSLFARQRKKQQSV